MLNLNDMIAARTVKDGKEYSYGYYHERKPVYGFYLYSKKDSLMDGLEIYAKSKFKLEKDAENYVQDARYLAWIALDDYYTLYGDKGSEEDVRSWVYKVVTRKLMDIARTMKSNVSVYDVEKREFIINDILYFDDNDDNDEDFSDKLNMYVEKYRQTMAQKSHGEFRVWLHENMGKILTKKQVDYINGDIFIGDKNKAAIHKNIVKRIDNVYSDETISESRTKIIDNKIYVLEFLIDSDNEKILSYKLKNTLNKEEWVQDILYELSFETCKSITNLINRNICLSKENSYEICSSLIKVLDFLIEIKKN